MKRILLFLIASFFVSITLTNSFIAQYKGDERNFSLIMKNVEAIAGSESGVIDCNQCHFDSYSTCIYEYPYACLGTRYMWNV